MSLLGIFGQTVGRIATSLPGTVPGRATLWDATTDRRGVAALAHQSVAILGAAALLWAALLRGWLPMPQNSLDAPMTAPGVPEAMATAAGLDGVATYLLMWGVMMSAMMYPAMYPYVRGYLDGIGGGVLRQQAALWAFFVPYSLVWTATGVVPLTVDLLVPVHDLVSAAPGAVLGVGFLAAGLHQLSSYKHRFLDHCCDCSVREVSRSLGGIARDGLAHARSCLGCTWAPFALMVLLGSMNPAVMLGLTLLVTLERAADRGHEVAAASGVLSVALGALCVLSGALALV
ncbi:DUF2182 domain-containing protein [Haloarchaeobius amylolyticus]|uniref:DUF2182 domain-containing protein n=1 Tax=Haloarchaeobius amylolyticus TaxID=1198296 RepID=UPI00226E9955|nr:DUF2182 domain-containing protein [Haloarchaeobius amylolyticus]